MSDFDKEAERERLREKYEREEAKREVTERMSELLLQGATMTNAHCSDCGDPIFRYEGQEFCATCEKPVDRGGDGAEASEGADTAGDDADGDAAGDGERIQVTSPSDDARVRFGAGAGAEGDETPEGEAVETHAGDEAATGPAYVDHTQRTVADPPAGDQPAGDAPGGERSAGEGAGTGRQEPRGAHQGGSPRPRGAVNVDQARGALQRTLTRLSQQAEATEDPREAEAYLAAAREAAETLAALRR